MLVTKNTTVSIPDTVTELEYKAFAGCVGLSDIEIPDSVEAIGGYAFEKWDIYNERIGDTAWYDAQADGDVYAGKGFTNIKEQSQREAVLSIRKPVRRNRRICVSLIR